MAVEARVIDRNGQQVVVFPDGTEVPLARVQAAMAQRPVADGPQLPPRADAPMSVSTGPAYQFGDVGRGAGNDELSAAYDTLSNATNVGTYDPILAASRYAGSLGQAGLLGAIGAGKKVGGYAADALGAGYEALGGDRWATGGAANAMYGDMSAGIQAAGVGPEARMLEVLSSAGAGRSAVDAADLTAREALAYARAVGEGDWAFLRGGGVPQSLSSANTGSVYNALARMPQSAIDNATPFTRRGADEFAAPRAGGGRAKDAALFNEYSKIRQGAVTPYEWEVTGRKLAGVDTAPVTVTPTDIRSQFDYLYGYPSDSTMLNTVIDSVNGKQLPQSILQQAGQSFPDGPFGFASEAKALATKVKPWRAAKEVGERIGVTPMTMGAPGGDFSQHVGQTFAQMVAANADSIDPKFVPSYPEALQKKLKGNIVGLLDPRFPYWLESLSGSNRAAVLKVFDKSDALAAGVPSVGAARWATTHPELAGSELLSSGFRVFEPYPSAMRRHGGDLHATYDAIVDKVGPSMTMGQTRPWTLMFPDVAYPKLVASTKAGRNILEDKAKPKDLRALQMNPKLRQEIDNQWEDTNLMYDEILKSRGKTAADMYALEAMMDRASMRNR